VRPDLTGPDGRPGADLRGYTVKNHYREMSRGADDITGQVAQLVVDAVVALARRQPDFPGPTTTSRTRATPTATATCSSPTGSSTTS
jgi:hypothetical protein